NHRATSSMMSRVPRKRGTETRNSQKTDRISPNETSLAIHSNLRPNLVPSSSEVFLRRRDSDRGRESERGRVADRLQASMQEMQQAMDLHGRNLPRRLDIRLRMKCPSRQWKKRSRTRHGTSRDSLLNFDKN